MKSGTPSPSASSSTLAGTVVLRRVKLTVMGVTPDRGLASKVIPGPGVAPIGSKTGGWLGRGVTVTFTDAVLFARPSVTWSWKVRTVSAVTTGAVKPGVAEPAPSRGTAGAAGWGR